MTEIKPPYDELDAIINEYVDNYEFNFDEVSHTPSEFEMTLIKDAIYGLLADTDWDNAWGRHIAALAKIEQGKPVAWQYRTRPDWEKDWQQSWMYCSKGAFEDYTRTPLLHDWHYEVRELFTHPAREPVLGTKTWMEGGVVMTQNLTASDIYKPAPMTEDEFITAIEASGIEVENVDAAFAIKRVVELFHSIKGATE